MKKQDTYKETRVFYYDNAIVTVHFPDITPEEHERRVERVKEAAAKLLKEAIRAKKARSSS